MEQRLRSWSLVFSQLRQGDVEPVEDWSTWYAEYRLGLRWRTSSRPASCSPPSGGNSSARSIIADVRTTARTPVFQEPANLATELYLDELDESVADDLRDRLAALKRRAAPRRGDLRPHGRER